MRSGRRGAERVRERRVEPLGGDRDLAASEPERRVAQQRARARGPASASTWKPLQMPSTRPPVGGEAGDGAHDRAEPGDDAGPQVVAVREPAGQDDRGDPVERRLLVPQRDRLGAGQRRGAWSVSRSQLLPGKTTTPIRTPTVSPPPRRRSRVDDVSPSGSTAYASMSGFDSSSEASRSTTARAAGSSAASTVSSTRRPTRTSCTPSMPRWPRLPSTARPCGSRMPGLGVTLTANRKLRHRAITSSSR